MASADATKTLIGTRTRVGILVSVSLGAILYLGLTLAVPHVVPRLAVLPAPSPSTELEHCEGFVETKTEVRWSRAGLFWTRDLYTLGGMCPTG